MLHKPCGLFALLIAICALFACGAAAAPAVDQDTDLPQPTIGSGGVEDWIVGEWLVKYVTLEGMMMSTEQYGLRITLTLNPDGSAVMDFNGEIADGMSWAATDGRVFLSGYNEEKDVEIDVRDYGLIITDEIGTLYLSRDGI